MKLQFYKKYIYFIFFYFINIALAVDKCVPSTPCKCRYEDGRSIDLTPLAKQDFIQGSKDFVLFYFHPCSNKNLTIKNITSNECANGGSLCMYDIDAKKVTNFGKVEDGKFKPSKMEEGVYDITFTNSKINKTISVTIACSPFHETVLYVDTDPNKQDLMLFTNYACPRLDERGMSTGSVLIIILIIFSTVYLLGGACVLHFLRGARGREMIPNIEFWSDLPLLVRDGVVFLQNGCKPPEQPGETYDRI